jgi:hypothetical protein
MVADARICHEPLATVAGLRPAEAAAFPSQSGSRTISTTTNATAILTTPPL